MARRYVPRRADIVRLTFHPQVGHEQAGRRPALVLSPESYNGRVGVKSLDWRARRAQYVTRLPQTAVDDVLDRLGTLLGGGEG